MTNYPVHYRAVHPLRFTRVQLAARVVAFCALGALGLSFGTLFAFAYLALPVFAAVRIGSRDPTTYLEQDGPNIVRALRWLAAVCAWAGLVSDRMPSSEPHEIVEVHIDSGMRPTPGSAIWRVVFGVPSALVLSILGCIGTVVWLWAALSVLFTERVGQHAFRYLSGLQRWSIRLLAYQASLVDEYPPFSFEDAPAPPLPNARVAS